MPIAASNSLSNILDLYTKARGTTTSTSTQSNSSKESVDGLIQQILSSTQGLASVSSGQKGAGLYNSSTNSMLTNDLLSQTASKVSSMSAGSTTTQKSGGISGSDLQNGLLLAAGKSILGPSISGAAKKLGLGAGGKTMGQSLADMLGLGESSSGGDALAGSPGDYASADYSNLSNPFSDNTAGQLDFSSFFNEATPAFDLTSGTEEAAPGFFDGWFS